jgi:DNA-directed RNA polymerase subunit E"
MTQKDKVCRNCKRFVEESKCPVCSQSNFSRSWKGIVVINDPKESEIAQTLGISVPGKYCLWVK